MKIEYCLYQLNPENTVQFTRKGALLKVYFSSNQIGYADCHPWHELGDLPLSDQLKLLRRRELTALTRCSLACARLDATARVQGKRLLDAKAIPASHFLGMGFLNWTEHMLLLLVQKGFTHIKLKVGKDIYKESAQLLQLFTSFPFQLRLDFNESLNEQELLSFLNRIESLKEKIDFLEDPLPFNPISWQQIQEKGWSLACDRQVLKALAHPESASVLVFKPALIEEANWKIATSRRKVITSYLDHPLGQLHAAFVASQIDPQGQEIHGLTSHHVYATHAFSASLSWYSPYLTVPSGLGLGFDQELAQLEWKDLP